MTTTATTLRETIVLGKTAIGGYRRLERGAGEPHLVRRDLGGPPSGRLVGLCTFAHLSDLHVTDAQSPARAEFLDRFGDEDSPFAKEVGRVGVYRAQEALTVQVVDAMAQALQKIERGPLLGMPVEFAFSTGDATDNCQRNELESYVALLNGGQKVTVDSGASDRYEGVGSPALYDVRYWHPDGTPAGEADDLPRATRGFPVVPGLLDAARTPIAASGLGIPWYAVYGNHDALFGGTLPQFPALVELTTGATKRVGVRTGFDPRPLLLGNETRPPDGLWALLDGPIAEITADPGRHAVTRPEWIAAHLDDEISPFAHGFTDAARAADRAYYAFDRGPLRFLVLDTVNSAGGWQGSLDAEQFAWLEEELAAGHRRFARADGRLAEHSVRDRLFALVSHHTLETLTNDYAPEGERRHLANDLETLIARFPNVVLWVNGHTHVNAVRPVAMASSGAGCWQLTTASHIDWPQQSRIVEVALDEGSGELVIISTVFDHAGLLDPRRSDLDDPMALAGWSRELSANAWQGRRNALPIGRGAPEDRNVICTRPLSCTRSDLR